MIHMHNFPGKQRVFRRPGAPGIYQAGHVGARGLEYQEGGGSQGQPKADDQVLKHDVVEMQSDKRYQRHYEKVN